MTLTQTTDTCTDNHCVLSSIFKASTQALSDGNLKVVGSNSNAGVGGTQTLFDGAYWEIKNTTNGSASGQRFGVTSASAGVDFPNAGHGGTQTGQNNYHVWDQNNTIYVNTGSGAGSAGTHSAWSSLTTNDIISFHVDGTNLKVRKNNDSFDTIVASFTATDWIPFVESYNGTMELRFQADSWTQTLPTGAKAINTTNQNSANAPTIEDGSKYFNTSTYEGNGGTRRTGQYQPLTESFSVSKSIIMNDDDSAYLNKTFSSAGNRILWTFSTWIKRGDLTANNYIFDATGRLYLRFVNSSAKLEVGNASDTILLSKRVFKELDTWGNLVWVLDASQSTVIERMRCYWNGVEITQWDTDQRSTYITRTGSTGDNQAVNNNVAHFIGKASDATTYNDQYLAQTVFIDGTALTPSSFGQIDTTTNRWIPKDVSGLTFGSNGFYLDMAVAPGTGNGPGNDVSGNNNDFSVNGLAAGDQSNDTPTNNFSVITSLEIGGNGGTATMSEGNLKVVQGSGSALNMFGSIPISSGKWHYEVTLTNREDQFGLGIIPLKLVNGNTNQFFNNGIGAQLGGTHDGKVYDGGSQVATIVKGGADDGNTVACEIDLDNGKLEWFNNAGVSLGTYSFTKDPLNGGQYLPCIHINDNGTFVANFGQNTFSHTPTTGFSAISQDNLPATTSNVSDLVWIKNRDASDSHMLFDRVRGIQKDLHSDAANEQDSSNANTLVRFLQAGAELSNDVQVNTDGESYVAWNWAAGGATTSTPSGSSGISSLAVSTSTDAGFSIGTFTAQSSGADGVVAHGLGGQAAWILLKPLATSAEGDNWCVWHIGINATSSNGTRSNLDSTGAVGSGAARVNAAGTSTFTINDDAYFHGRNFVFYAWKAIPGYSAFGSYEGNNDSSNGAFIHLGFKPAFFMAKNADTTGAWLMFDSTREPSNLVDLPLEADDPKSEAASGGRVCDFLSSGVKIRGNSSYLGSAHTFIYMAFAEHPFAGTTPVTAV